MTNLHDRDLEVDVALRYIDAKDINIKQVIHIQAHVLSGERFNMPKIYKTGLLQLKVVVAPVA